MLFFSVQWGSSVKVKNASFIFFGQKVVVKVSLLVMFWVLCCAKLGNYMGDCSCKCSFYDSSKG